MVLTQISNDIEGILSQVKVDLSTLSNDLKQNINQATVVEVLLEELELRSLKDGLQTGQSPVVISVVGDHLDEVLVSIQAVDHLWDERQQVAEQTETVDLQLLLLRRLPPLELWVLGLWVQVKEDGVQEVELNQLLVGNCACLVSGSVENGGPEELFELHLLVISGEDVLLLAWLYVLSLV